MRVYAGMLLFLTGFVQTAGLFAQAYKPAVGFTRPELLAVVKTYRLPDWHYWVVDFSGGQEVNNREAASSTNWQNETVSTYKDRRSFHLYSLNPRIRYARESERFLVRSFLEGGMQGNQYGEEHALSRALISPQDLQGWQRKFKMNQEVSGRLYPVDPDGFYAGGETAVRLEDDLSTYNYRRRSQIRTVGATLFAGFGRIRNVTPTIRAVRFYERARARNSAFEADRQQIQQNAQQFARYSGYSAAYSRPEKFFWNDLFQANPSLGALTPYDVLYLAETLLENVGERFEGQEVQFGIHRQGVLNRLTGYSDLEGTTVDRQAYRFTSLYVNGKMARNLALDLQVQAEGGAFFQVYDSKSYPEQRFISDRFNFGREGFLMAEILYNVADRTSISGGAEAYINQKYDHFDAPARMTESGLTLFGNAVWFIENRLGLTAQVRYFKGKSTRFFASPHEFDAPSGDFRWTDSNGRVEIRYSLHYYFMRGVQ